MDDTYPPRLLADHDLESSAVVANCAMNRLRGLQGVNSYSSELGFNPLELLTSRAESAPSVGMAWLDLCCGSGRALIEAAEWLEKSDLIGEYTLVGVDLVEAFDAHSASWPQLDLVCSSVTSWTPWRSFDLITCVHGLHYVGDKLGLLTRAAGWLAPDGLLVADLDLANVRRSDGRPGGRLLAGRIRAAGFDWNPRRHRVTLRGARAVSLGYRYLGSNDRAEANYTGQPAVDSYYLDGT